jgi:amidohydrolase
MDTPLTILQSLTSSSFKDELIHIRRELHQIPEPGFKEFKTSQFIANILQKLGISSRTGIAQTGIIAEIQASKNPDQKKTIALRADIDALPLEERTGLPFSSKHPGYFHACGHDMHVAGLIGALILLNERKDNLPVNVRAIFQPAEETLPGGASAMIAEGALENPEVSAIFGLHCDPYIPTGTIAVKAGPMMAATARFTIRIIGKGGHAARPFNCIDPIPIAAQVITALQTIPSRMIDPLKPCVFSVTKINAGTANNIIPQEAVFSGTARTLDAETAEEIPIKIETIIRGIVSAFGAEYQFDYKRGAPVLVNDAQMTVYVQTVARNLLGDDIVRGFESTFGGEDFAEYLKIVPGCFFRLGCLKEGSESIQLHNEKFNPDEQALIYGSALLAELAMRFE